MFERNSWPFTPLYLSQVIDKDTLAVIESGCCERLQRPLTILERQTISGGFDRIESINEKQRYEPHCQYFRSHVKRDELCKSCDIKEAYRSMSAFEETGDPFREFNCHLGLIDMTYVICIGNHSVAEVFSGQFMPVIGVEEIKERILRYRDKAELEITPGVENELIRLADVLTKKPENARELFEKEALHIQNIANSKFKSIKREWEEEFLDQTRKLPGDGGFQNLKTLQDAIKHILKQVQSFCRCEYLVLFASFLEGDTVLIPVAQSGLHHDSEQSLPHFNWKKANLPLTGYDIRDYSHLADKLVEWKKSIRGDNSQLFAEARCVLPVSLNDRFRGVLVFGPFAEQVDLEQERRFLLDVANTVSLIALTGLEVLYLEQERHRWESSARLISHQMNTALTPINTLIGRAKSTLNRKGGNLTTEKVTGFLEQSENMVINLSRGAMKTLKSHVFHIVKDDFTFVSFPLSVMVSNCADSFVGVASDKNREILVEPAVELLPDAEIDVARLTIALANLIDNAVKYSYQGTKIYIRARYSLGASDEDAMAEIEVDDIGFEIMESESKKIFEQGVRGQSVLKIARIVGTGFGLWEALAIARAHGGDIRVTCTPTYIKRREGAAHRVVFTLKIPLSQKKSR